MDTPLYDELVVKYYLSRGIVPFSYPHEPIKRAEKGVSIRKHKVRVGDLNGATVGQYIDLMTKAHEYSELAKSTGQPVVVARQRPRYDYFRL